MITTVDKSDLAPGASDLEVELGFWTDEARIHATPGTTFVVWYGRPVGRGVVAAHDADEH